MRLHAQLLPFIFLVALLTPSGSTEAQPNPVEAWEGTIDLPTYAWEDDPYPRFWALEDKIVYPYPMQDVISTTRENRRYKALFLENDYLKVICLPELGGRLFSVLNKITGEEMFHRNDVVKPGLIGMRGAWISGGVEWNTGPHGHTVTAISPVNALVRKNSDGSATLFVSNTEQIFRTRWRVDVTLHPDRSYLHEEVSLFNPQDEIHPYYFWNCTAFPCGEGTRFIFPMTLGCDHHGREFFTWPMHEGKDISWLKNYDRPTSVFAWECDQDFFGCYDVDLDKGLVQVADHRILKGKKAWTWGQSDDGRVSQNALTDDDGPYIEVQSGPLLTQADYGELFPRQEVAWEEWWYPVFGFDEGFDFANKDVVVEVATADVGGSEVLDSIHLLSTRPFPGTTLTLQSPGEEEAVFEIDLSPREAARVSVKDSGMTAGKVRLADSAGNEIAAFNFPANLEIQTPPEFPAKKDESEMDANELFALGLEKDRETSRPDARQFYEKALEKEPGHVEAIFRLGVLDLESGLYESAKGRFESAIEVAPNHPWASHFLGAALFKMGDFAAALRTADRTIEARPDLSAAYDLKGRALMRLGRRDQVIPVFEESVRANPRDQRARDHLIMAYFAAGRNDEAFATAHDAVREDPTALIPRAILNFNDPEQPKNFFQETFRFLGEHPFEYIEAQEMFRELGMPRAAFLFASPLMLDPFGGSLEFSPLQYFHSALGVWEIQQLQAAAGLLRRLEDWSVEFVFPSRLESIEALSAMKILTPEDGRMALLLGNAYADLGRLDEAVAEWTEAVRLDPNLAQAHRNLGVYYWKKEEDLERAAAFLRRAVALEPTHQTLHAELAEILSDRPDEVVEAIAELGFDKIRRNDLREALARAYNDLGEYAKTIEFLNAQTFSNWESRQASRNLWVRALIESGKEAFEKEDFDAALAYFETAITYPENLGVGRPAETRDAEAHYWRGETLKKLGRMDEAKEAWRLGASETEGSGAQKEHREKCATALGEN